MTITTQSPASHETDEIRMVASERLTFFADAVVAIAITLLALDLPEPTGSTNAELLGSVGRHSGEYAAFLISFAVIGAAWSGHHRVFRYVTSLGGTLTGLTLAWLLMQVVTPFATRVLTGDGAFQARFGFYALIQCCSGLFFLGMVWEIRHRRLYRPETPPGLLRGAMVRTGVMAGSFLVSIPVSFVTHWAYLCWILLPFVIALASLLIRRVRGSAARHR